MVHRDGGFYSPRTVSEFHLKDDAAESIAEGKRLGFLYIVISNQPDVSRGKMSVKELLKITDFMTSSLDLDDVIYCTHDDDNDTGCRKPEPGMFLQAQDKWKIDLANSFMVGDTWKDLEAAKRAGVTPLLINADYNKNLDTEYRVENLLSAVRLIDKLVCDRQQDLKGKKYK